MMISRYPTISLVRKRNSPNSFHDSWFVISFHFLVGTQEHLPQALWRTSGSYDSAVQIGREGGPMSINFYKNTSSDSFRCIPKVPQMWKRLKTSPFRLLRHDLLPEWQMLFFRCWTIGLSGKRLLFFVWSQEIVFALSPKICWSIEPSVWTTAKRLSTGFHAFDASVAKAKPKPKSFVEPPVTVTKEDLEEPESDQQFRRVRCSKQEFWWTKHETMDNMDIAWAAYLKVWRWYLGWWPIRTHYHFCTFQAGTSEGDERDQCQDDDGHTRIWPQSCCISSQSNLHEVLPNTLSTKDWSSYWFEWAKVMSLKEEYHLQILSRISAKSGEQACTMTSHYDLLAAKLHC